MSEAKPIEIEIFRVGRQVDKDGVTVDFSAADAAAMIAAYDPATDPAPLVVGHPKTDHPAYGWAKSLRLSGDVVVATPDQVEPAFAEMVGAGRFKRVSASFYQPGDSRSPNPAGYYLKHIGFLGAAAPSVKGLKTVAFADDGAGVVTFDFTAQETNVDDTDLTQRLTALEAREAALAEREAAATARDASFAEQTTAARHELNVAFAETLVQAGKLGGGDKGRDLVVGVLDNLSTEATLSFAEGGTLSPVQAFRQLLEGAGKIVDFSERAGGKTEGGDASDPSELADKAIAFAASEKAAGRIVTIAAAVRHVAKQG